MGRDDRDMPDRGDVEAPQDRHEPSNLRLSERDSELFLSALEEEPRELPVLRAAAARRRERFGE